LRTPSPEGSFSDKKLIIIHKERYEPRQRNGPICVDRATIYQPFDEVAPSQHVKEIMCYKPKGAGCSVIIKEL
jgi:hypothetical protein